MSQRPRFPPPSLPQQSEDRVAGAEFLHSVEELVMSELAAIQAAQETPDEDEEESETLSETQCDSHLRGRDSGDTAQPTPETAIPAAATEQPSALDIELAIQQTIASALSTPTPERQEYLRKHQHLPGPRGRVYSAHPAQDYRVCMSPQALSQESLSMVQTPSIERQSAAKRPPLRYRSLCDYVLPEGDRRQVWDTDYLRLAFGEVEEIGGGMLR